MNAEKSEIQTLIEYADSEENYIIVNKDTVRNPVIAGDNPNHVTYIDDFRVVYSIEKQPCGLVKHLSVSRKTPDVITSDQVWEIALLFAFKKHFKTNIWNERPGLVINLAQKAG